MLHCLGLELIIKKSADYPCCKIKMVLFFINIFKCQHQTISGFEKQNIRKKLSIIFLVKFWNVWRNSSINWFRYENMINRVWKLRFDKKRFFCLHPPTTVENRPISMGVGGCGQKKSCFCQITEKRLQLQLSWLRFENR